MTNGDSSLLTRFQDKLESGDPITQQIAYRLLQVIKDRVRKLSFILRKPEPCGMVPATMYVLADNHFWKPTLPYLAKRLGAALKELASHPSSHSLFDFTEDHTELEDRWDLFFHPQSCRSVDEEMMTLAMLWDDTYADVCAAAKAAQ